MADRDFTLPAAEVSQPSWTDDSLAMAEAISKHLPIIKVGQPEHIEGPSAYASYLEDLRQMLTWPLRAKHTTNMWRSIEAGRRVSVRGLHRCQCHQE